MLPKALSDLSRLFPRDASCDARSVASDADDEDEEDGLDSSCQLLSCKQHFGIIKAYRSHLFDVRSIYINFHLSRKVVPPFLSMPYH